MLRTMLNVYLFSILFFNFLHRYIFRILLSNVLTHSLRVSGSGTSGHSSMEIIFKLILKIYLLVTTKSKGIFPFLSTSASECGPSRGETQLSYIWYRGTGDVKIRTMGILSYTHFDSLGDFFVLILKRPISMCLLLFLF